MENYGAVVLAGDRAGVDPFAATFDAAAKVLVPVAGRASLARVVDTLRSTDGCRGGVVCGPDREAAASSAICSDLFAVGDFVWVEPLDGPAASALAGVEALGAQALSDGGVLLTTGDHALLCSRTVETFCRAAKNSPADFVVGLVRYERVLTAFPGSKRTVWRFADGAFCGCNLFFVRTAQGRRLFSFWRSVETLRKQPWKIAGRLGWATLARYFARRLTVQAAFDALSRRAGCRIGHVEIADPHAAVDVDSVADWRLADEVLRSRDENPHPQQSE